MRTFIARRLFSMLIVWLGVSILTFLIATVIPSDPVALRLGPKATPEAIQHWRHEYGLDQPLPQQYLRFASGLLHLDLGTSIWSGRPVMRDLADYFPATLELTLLTMLLAVGLGIPLGILAANHPHSFYDRLVQVLSTIGLALPLFWVGLVFQLFFYRQINIFPLDGRIDLVIGPPVHVTGLYILDSLLTLDLPRLGSSLLHAVLPAFTLSLPAVGGVARMMRGSLLEVLSQDYIRAARAKGASWGYALRHHALKNALLPVVTLLGNTFNAMLAGAFVVEAIFNWPGLGWYATKVILASDYGAVVSITLVIAVICTLVNLLVDILYGALDPRIQLS